MKRLISLFVIAAVALLAGPGTAQAADYCVGSPPGCSGTSQPDLQAALDAADSNSGPDRVLLGPGTYSRTDGFVYSDGNSSNTVDIVGVGSPRPTVTMTTVTSGINVLTVANQGSTVSNLDVAIPTLASSLFPKGLALSGASAQNVAVTGNDPGTQQTGIQMQAGSSVDDSSINLAITNGVGIYVITNSDVSVTDTSITTARAADVATGAGTATFSRDRMSAYYYGLYMYDGALDVDNTLIDMRGGGRGPGNSAGLYIFTVGGLPTSDVNARQLTIRNGDADTIGVREETSTVNSTIDVDIRNSIIDDVGHPLVQGPVSSGSTYSITSTNNDYDPAGNLPVVPTMGMSRTETGTVTVPPAFIAPIDGANGIAGDYRLRFDSPLIDAGTPGALSPGEADLGGRARIVDGALPLSGAERDIGAYEYQRAAPVAQASASPSTGTTGAAIAFSAVGSTDVDGDALTYAWNFDDGATATGPTASHAFAAPGAHSGTVTVTDSTGLTGSATAQVAVAAPTPTTKAKCKKKKRKKRSAGAAKKKCKKKKKRK